MVLISDFVPRDGEVGTNDSLNVVGNHHIQVLQLGGGREEEGGRERGREGRKGGGEGGREERQRGEGQREGQREGQ